MHKSGVWHLSEEPQIHAERWQTQCELKPVCTYQTFQTDAYNFSNDCFCFYLGINIHFWWHSETEYADHQFAIPSRWVGQEETLVTFQFLSPLISGRHQQITKPFLYFSLSKGDINIFHASSFHIMLQTRFGLQIQIQHVPVMQVYVSLEPSYKTKTRGKL